MDEAREKFKHACHTIIYYIALAVYVVVSCFFVVIAIAMSGVWKVYEALTRFLKKDKRQNG